jgi:hypothetical protein
MYQALLLEEPVSGASFETVGHVRLLNSFGQCEQQPRLKDTFRAAENTFQNIRMRRLRSEKVIDGLFSFHRSRGFFGVGSAILVHFLNSFVTE